MNDAEMKKWNVPVDDPAIKLICDDTKDVVVAAREDAMVYKVDEFYFALVDFYGQKCIVRYQPFLLNLLYHVYDYGIKASKGQIAKFKNGDKRQSTRRAV